MELTDIVAYLLLEETRLTHLQWTLFLLGLNVMGLQYSTWNTEELLIHELRCHGYFGNVLEALGQSRIVGRKTKQQIQLSVVKICFYPSDVNMRMRFIRYILCFTANINANAPGK